MVRDALISSRVLCGVWFLFFFFLWKVSERVERRLQEMEQEMRAERQLVERHQDHLGHMSLQLQEVCKQKCPVRSGLS